MTVPPIPTDVGKTVAKVIERRMAGTDTFKDLHTWVNTIYVWTDGTRTTFSDSDVDVWDSFEYSDVDETGEPIPLEEPTPEEPSQTAEEWWASAGERRRRAAEEETLATMLLLAQMAREEFPEAKGIVLEDSDQGNFYTVGGVLDAQGEVIDEDNELDANTGYVYGLDDTVFDTIHPFCMKAEDGTERAYIDRRRGVSDTVLDIDAVLEGVKPA
jgi:hypothetical protein